MKLPKTKIGDILHLTFWDHSETEGTEDGRLLFEAFGKLVWEDENYFKITTWSTPDQDFALFDPNSEYYWILKSACTKARILK